MNSCRHFVLKEVATVGQYSRNTGAYAVATHNGNLAYLYPTCVGYGIILTGGKYAHPDAMIPEYLFL
jgi:hypothetical protein